MEPKSGYRWISTVGPRFRPPILLQFSITFASKERILVLTEKIRRQLSRKFGMTRIGTVAPRFRPPILLQLSISFASKGEFWFSQKKTAASYLGNLV